MDALASQFVTIKMDASASQFVAIEPMHMDKKTPNIPHKSKNPQHSESLATKATWDYQHNRLLLQLMASLTKDGYRRGGGLFVPVGYAKLIGEFNKQTGKSLKLSQFKSPIEKLRRDWKAWQSIKSPGSTCTGMGWNSDKGTWDTPDKWCSLMAELNPNILKFKENGLKHEDLMAQVFHGTAATGEMHWSPSAAQ